MFCGFGNLRKGLGEGDSGIIQLLGRIEEENKHEHLETRALHFVGHSFSLPSDANIQVWPKDFPYCAFSLRHKQGQLICQYLWITWETGDRKNI